MLYHDLRVLNKGIKENGNEDVQSKLTMTPYHLGQAAPFATTSQPLSTWKLSFHQI